WAWVVSVARSRCRPALLWAFAAAGTNFFFRCRQKKTAVTARPEHLEMKSSKVLLPNIRSLQLQMTESTNYIALCPCALDLGALVLSVARLRCRPVLLWAFAAA
ncbi:unnamed protein product, partial [Scytosiphon promiscuus]